MHKDYRGSDEWREIFMKQSVNKCRCINFCNICVVYLHAGFTQYTRHFAPRPGHTCSVSTDMICLHCSQLSECHEGCVW